MSEPREVDERLLLYVEQGREGLAIVCIRVNDYDIRINPLTLKKEEEEESKLKRCAPTISFPPDKEIFHNDDMRNFLTLSDEVRSELERICPEALIAIPMTSSALYRNFRSRGYDRQI